MVETGKGVSRQILGLTETILLISRSLQAVVVILALIAVSFATIIATMSRIEYYRILRIIGASRLFLTAAILVKYAILGLAGAWAGSALLRLAAGRFAEHFRLTGIMVPVAVPDDAFRTVLLFGAMIPGAVRTSCPGTALFQRFEPGLVTARPKNIFLQNSLHGGYCDRPARSSGFIRTGEWPCSTELYRAHF